MNLHFRYIPIQQENGASTDAKPKPKPAVEPKSPLRPAFEWSIVNLKSLHGPTTITKSKVTREETTKTSKEVEGAVQTTSVVERTLAQTCISPTLVERVIEDGTKGKEGG